MNEIYLTDLIVIPNAYILMKYFKDKKFIYISDIHSVLSKKVIVRKLDSGLYEEIVTHRVFKSLPIDMLANFAYSDICGYVIIPNEFSSRLDDSSFGYKIISDYIVSHDYELYSRELDEFVLNANCFESLYVSHCKNEKDLYKNASLKLLTLENKANR